jgi:glutamate-ammonia-ligase adenylyltransferase
VREHIHHIRKRMEDELAVETASRRDFKRGRGGLLDVENVVQLRQLELAVERPDLLAPLPVEELLQRLSALEALRSAQAADLLEGWDFLQRLSSRLRVVENRSISDLDEERGDLDGLARRLGYSAGSRESSARRALLDDYAGHTRAIRAAYLEILGVDR